MSLKSNLRQQDVTGDFMVELESKPVRQIIAMIAMEKTVRSSAGSFGFAGAVPKPGKREDGQERGRLAAHKIKYDCEDYSNAIVIDKDDYEEDDTGTVQAAIGDLAESHVLDEWEQVITLHNNGTVSGNNSYDGQTFYDTDHSLGQANQSNKITNSDVAALNVASATAPTPEEMVDVLTGMAGHMIGFKDERNRALNRFARHFVAAVPTNMFASGITSIAANNLTSGQTNVIASVNEASGTGRIYVNDFKFDLFADPDLTDTDAVILHRADSPAKRKPFIIVTKRAVEAHFLGPGSEYAIDKDEYLAKTTVKRDFLYGEPLYSLHGTLS